MIARINLLPWREEYRQEKKVEFFKLVGLVVFLGVVAIGVWDRVVSGRIANQESRNSRLEQKIAELDVKVQEIEKLKAQRAELLERMIVIQSLQANRPEIVKMFDELTVAVPAGVFLSNLERVGSQVSLTGFAESNNRVSTFMRNLDESYKFKEPNLTEVLADDRLGEQGNTFEMRVRVVDPEVLLEGAAEGQGEGANQS